MKPVAKVYLLITGLFTFGILVLMTGRERLNNKYFEYVFQAGNVRQSESLYQKLFHNKPQYFLRNRTDFFLLTMFTSFKEHPNNTHHNFAHSMVITNWASFEPFVKPVLFAKNSDSKLAKFANTNSWDVLPLSRANPSGAPFLKDMYKTVHQNYNSTFYGFANGDLMFDGSLVTTLEEIKRNLDFLNNNVLVVGIRTNVDINSYLETDKKEFAKENLQNISKSKGKLFIAMSEDYFFITRSGCTLNWTSIADVVIGRVAYDNYMVAVANKHKVNTIDATKTLLAVHVSKKGVTETGRQNADNDFNFNAIGPFNYGLGLTTSAKFETNYDLLRKTYIVQKR